MYAKRIFDLIMLSDRPSMSDAYDRLVTESPQGSIYCRRWWLEAVAPGRYRINAVARNGKLLAAWPLVTSANEGRTDVTMPPMTQKLGILYTPFAGKYSVRQAREHDLATTLIDELPDGAFDHRFHEAFTSGLPFHWRGFTQTTRYTYVLCDLQDHNRVWREMRPAARQTINKAVKLGLTVRDNVDFERLLDLNEQVFARQGLAAPVSREFLRRLDAAVRRHANRRIFAAFDPQGRLHAAAYVVWDAGTAYYLMSGSDPALRASGALYLALWEAIRHAGTVAHTFDFEGSMIKNLEYAFRCMGARQQPYMAISRPAPAAAVQLRIRKFVGRAVRRAARHLAAARLGAVQTCLWTVADMALPLMQEVAAA